MGGLAQYELLDTALEALTEHAEEMRRTLDTECHVSRIGDATLTKLRETEKHLVNCMGEVNAAIRPPEPQSLPAHTNVYPAPVDDHSGE